MAPPVFTDLDKTTRDVFDKGHILDVFKLTAKNKTCGALAMKTNLTHKFEDASFKGDVEGTLPLPKYGLTITKKWNTKNVIGIVTEITNKYMPGVTLKAEGSFNPDSGEKAGAYNIAYKNFRVNAFAGIAAGSAAAEPPAEGEPPAEDGGSMLLDASAVVGHKSWLAGARVEYDNSSGSLKNHYLAIGNGGPGTSLQTVLIARNLQLFTANIYQKVSEKVEMALCFGTDLGEGKKFYNLGCRFQYDDTIAIKAKVNEESMVGLGIEGAMGAVKFIFSCLIDAKKINEGGHKLGFGVEI